jgi:hypothetical protein
MVPVVVAMVAVMIDRAAMAAVVVDRVAMVLVVVAMVAVMIDRAAMAAVVVDRVAMVPVVVAMVAVMIDRAAMAAVVVAMTNGVVAHGGYAATVVKHHPRRVRGVGEGWLEGAQRVLTKTSHYMNPN